MIFNSLTFLCFLAIVHLVYALPMSWQKRKAHLWFSSYLFYAAWNPPFVLLLWISTLVDWFAGKAINSTTSLSRRRLFLGLSLTTNLGLLGYFKYGEFLLDSFTGLIALAGIQYSPPEWQIVLPVGISFYTFQSLSYTLDIYKGRLQPWSRFSDFAFFVTFFPQLVAGPIVRAADFMPQCIEEKRANSTQMGWGFMLLTLGIFEKVILADALLAPVADQVFDSANLAGGGDAWTAIFAFSGQIFFDFSGYSLCAIGVAMTLGFVLPDNFRFPYAALGFSEFWRRWHISLSTWLRDYLYIPLGGNRKGTARTYINLMTTMLLGGLWHGASWRFVVWGGLHGLYLCIERLIRNRFNGPIIADVQLLKLAAGAATFCVISTTWVFFRAESFGDAFFLLSQMISERGLHLLSWQESLRVGVTIVLLFSGHWLMRDSSLEEVAAGLPVILRVALPVAVLVILSLHSGGDRAFIYFQF
jgi:alginate O-acetyltransferase complex protein AlgI